MVSSAKVHNYFEIIHFFIVLLRQIWLGLPFLPHFSFLQSGLDERHLAAVLLEKRQDFAL